MNIDICRRCSSWREYLYTDDSARSRCIVELKCEKFKSMKWNIRLDNLDSCKVDDMMRKAKRRVCLSHDMPEYKAALGDCENECHMLFGKIIENYKVPDDCEYRLEQVMEKWNA